MCLTACEKNESSVVLAAANASLAEVTKTKQSTHTWFGAANVPAPGGSPPFLLLTFFLGGISLMVDMSSVGAPSVGMPSGNGGCPVHSRDLATLSHRRCQNIGQQDPWLGQKLALDGSVSHAGFSCLVAESLARLLLLDHQCRLCRKRLHWSIERQGVLCLVASCLLYS